MKHKGYEVSLRSVAGAGPEIHDFRCCLAWAAKPSQEPGSRRSPRRVVPGRPRGRTTTQINDFRRRSERRITIAFRSFVLSQAGHILAKCRPKSGASCCKRHVSAEEDHIRAIGPLKVRMPEACVDEACLEEGCLEVSRARLAWERGGPHTGLPRESLLRIKRLADSCCSDLNSNKKHILLLRCRLASRKSASY
jgi:hypothetical protein